MFYSIDQANAQIATSVLYFTHLQITVVRDCWEMKLGLSPQGGSGRGKLRLFIFHHKLFVVQLRWPAKARC